MQALAFWKAVTMDRTNFLEELFETLAAADVPFCVIGGQAVNSYVEPLVSLNLDIAVAAKRLDSMEALLAPRFKVERFPHSLNLAQSGSDLRVQIQTDNRYSEFVAGATVREVLGLQLPVAALPDVLQGKVWAALDEGLRSSKRRKDLLDIERIIEAYPKLR